MSQVLSLTTQARVLQMAPDIFSLCLQTKNCKKCDILLSLDSI